MIIYSLHSMRLQNTACASILVRLMQELFMGNARTRTTARKLASRMTHYWSVASFRLTSWVAVETAIFSCPTFRPSASPSVCLSIRPSVIHTSPTCFETHALPFLLFDAFVSGVRSTTVAIATRACFRLRRAHDFSHRRCRSTSLVKPLGVDGGGGHVSAPADRAPSFARVLRKGSTIAMACMLRSSAAVH